MKYLLSIIIAIFAVATLDVVASPGHKHDEKPAEEHGEPSPERPGHHDADKETKTHEQGPNHHDNHGGGGHANAAGTPVFSDEKYDQLVIVTLLDTMRIEYQEPFDIEPGTIVKFVVTNKGKIRHEFSISNAEEQKAHVEMMRKMPNMKHEDGSTVSLESGETKELIWKFDGEQEVVFSCNIPGHSEAGMLTQVSLKGAHGHHDH